MQTARIFLNGRSQAVRLPKEFRFSGTDVYIKKIGNMVVLLPQKEYQISKLETGQSDTKFMGDEGINAVSFQPNSNKQIEKIVEFDPLTCIF